VARPNSEVGKTEATLVKNVLLVRFGSATGWPLQVRWGGRGYPLAGRGYPLLRVAQAVRTARRMIAALQ